MALDGFDSHANLNLLGTKGFVDAACYRLSMIFSKICYSYAALNLLFELLKQN